MNDKRKIKVMIVEDEQDLLYLYKDFLKNKGYVISVTNTTAIHILDDYLEFQPDLIILDYRLPDGKNGVDAAKEILLEYPSVPILLTSAYDSIESIFKNEEIFEGKKIVLVIKPIKLHLLHKLIQEIIST